MVDESNEANNTRTVTAPMAISRPDLSVTSVVATPTLAAAGMNVSVTQVVKNVALAPASAPASTSRLTLSSNTTLGDGDDVDLGTVAIPALAAAAQASVLKSVVIPGGTQPGLYWIFARANDGNPIPEAGGAGNNAARTAAAHHDRSRPHRDRRDGGADRFRARRDRQRHEHREESGRSDDARLRRRHLPVGQRHVRGGQR